MQRVFLKDAYNTILEFPDSMSEKEIKIRVEKYIKNNVPLPKALYNMFASERALLKKTVGGFRYYNKTNRSELSIRDAKRGNYNYYHYV